MALLLSLSQTTSLGAKQRFELREGGEMHVTISDRNGHQEYSFEISELFDRTVRASQRALGHWIFSGALLLAYLIIVVVVHMSNKHDPGLGTGMSVMLGLIFLPFTIGLAWQAYRKSYDVTLFHYRRSGQIALSIANKRPDPATVEQFITLLKKEIQRAAPLVEMGSGLSAEVAKLDELRARGILTTEEFVSAKQRLLQGAGVEEKRIGFAHA